ncbi:hypothetical protein LINPERPRIM_LOCUS29836, partial [Linum perenne]
MMLEGHPTSGTDWSVTLLLRSALRRRQDFAAVAPNFLEPLETPPPPPSNPAAIAPRDPSFPLSFQPPERRPISLPPLIFRSAAIRIPVALTLSLF